MKERFFSALWGAAGMIVLWVVSTTLANQQAIALQSQQIQQQADYDIKIDGKLDTIISHQTNLLTNTKSIDVSIASLNNDVKTVKDSNRQLRVSVAKIEHETSCGLRYDYKEPKAFQECVKSFNPNLIH